LGAVWSFRVLGQSGNVIPALSHPMSLCTSYASAPAPGRPSQGKRDYHISEFSHVNLKAILRAIELLETSIDNLLLNLMVLHQHLK